LEVVLTYRGVTGAAGTGWIIVSTADGMHVASGLMRDLSAPVPLAGTGQLIARLEALGLLPGRYVLSMGLFGPRNDIVDWCDQVITFDILQHYMDGRAFDQRLGVISQILDWRHEPEAAG
jgi:lipopolysaccharide transport system ATP-binding protein